MAISFIRLTFASVLPERGLGAIFAYHSRRALVDSLSGALADFTELAADLVHEGAVLPQGFPADRWSPQAIAEAIQDAEIKPTTDLRRLQRRPQAGLLSVMALPPDSECHLDEAIELSERLLERLRDGKQLPAHFVIHDPGQRGGSPSRNRHVHVCLGLREWRGNAFSRRKTRGLFGQVRESLFGKVVAEAVHWPQVAWALQETYFREVGAAVTVDPVAPEPFVHVSRRDWADKNDELLAHLGAHHLANRKAVCGDAAALIETLLRGRCSLRRVDVERVIGKWVPDQAEAGLRLARILTDERIICLAENPHRPPTILTTEPVLGLMHELETALAGYETLEDTVPARPRRGLSIVSRATWTEVQSKLAAVVEGWLQSQPLADVILAATRPSLLENLWSDTPFGAQIWRPRLAQLLDEAGEIPRGAVLVLPHLEEMPDQTLARVLLRAHAADAHILLGFDESKQRGFADSRLAARLVARFAARPSDAATPPALSDVERWLRAGLIEAGLQGLRRNGRLFFGECAAGTGATVLRVVDDPARLREGIEVHSTRDSAPPEGTPVPFAGGYAVVRSGDRVMIERTDYGERPPVIRAGQVAEVVRAGANWLTIRTSTGQLRTRDRDRIRDLRPAQAVTIREARHLLNLPMSIELSRPDQAWAGALLAARAQSASLQIAPHLAADPAALAQVIEAHAPAPLPTLFTRVRDTKAETEMVQQDLLTEILENLPALQAEDYPPLPGPGPTRMAPPVGDAGADIAPDPFEIPELPRPDDPTVPAADFLVAPALRTRLRERGAAEGLELLCQRLARGAPDRDQVKKRLLEAGLAPLLAALVSQLHGAPLEPNEDWAEALELAAADLGPIGEGAGLGEIERCCSDLVLMSLPYNDLSLVEPSGRTGKWYEPKPKL